MNNKCLGHKGGRKPTYLTSVTSVLTSVKPVSIAPSGGDKMDIRRENTEVKWIGFHPLKCFLIYRQFF